MSETVHPPAPSVDILKEDVMVLNMGPQHPSTHGVLRVILKLDGEKIVDLDCDIGFLHRGVEKLSENRSYTGAAPYMDRLDYIAAVSNNLAYIETVEKLAGVQPPPKAQYVRVVLTELTRIASHLLWLGTHAMDIGALTVFLYCFREREDILNILEMTTGARLTTNAFRVGGLAADVPEGFAEKTRAFCDMIGPRIDEYEGLLSGNRIWLSRTRGIGVISAHDAVAIGLSGPSLRASGVQWDLRKAQPYEAYPQFEFDIPTGAHGDTYDRYKVRLEEMRQAKRIILQALDGMPEGDFRAKVPRVLKPPAGEVYHSIEAPKGELGFYIVSDGSANPYRVRIKGPSFFNLQAMRQLCIGHFVADVVAIIGTLDIVLGEIDR
jgi:NADH-quinone oxidoreductase subunit D